jgi:hypothetical protein
MTDMIERVARAAFGERWKNHPDQREELLLRAALAIAVMREPTDEMWEAGHAAMEGPEAGGACVCWQAMIDAALEAGKG